jgi:hypothetical protein
VAEPNDNHHDSLLDELRESPVGTNDPNIVGNVGPTDIPPGQDPHGGLLVEVDENDLRDDPGQV